MIELLGALLLRDDVGAHILVTRREEQLGVDNAVKSADDLAAGGLEAVIEDDDDLAALLRGKTAAIGALLAVVVDVVVERDVPHGERPAQGDGKSLP